MTRLLHITRHGALLAATTLLILLRACWDALLFLLSCLNIIEDDKNDHHSLDGMDYNYRSGFNDPVKRDDGLYDD